MVTSTTYGGRGQPMDIDAINNGECFRCHQKGHISKNCLLQSWNKKKEEVRALTTEPSTGSKIEEVKDVAGNGWTYTLPVDNVSYMPHSILFAERQNQPRMESHNRYAVLATDIDTVSIASSDEDGDVTESSTNMTTQEEQHRHQLHDSTHDDKSSTRQLNIKATQGALIDSTAGASKGSPSTRNNHLTSSALHVKVPGDKPPTIVVSLIMASPCTRLEGAWELGPNSPCEVSSQDEQVAPRAENTTRIDSNDKAELAAHSPGTRKGLDPKVTKRVGKSAFVLKSLNDVTTKSAEEEKRTHQNAEEKHPLKAASVANATATKKIAAGQEVASAQAIERGHSVVMIKVPDHEDDTSFKLQQNKVAATDADACRPSPKRESPLQEREAEHPIGNDTSVSEGREAAKHAPPTVTSHEWLKPFETEWTWRAIKDAKDESATRAILLNWIHKTRAEEVVDNLLEGLCSLERFHALDWLDELRKPKRSTCKIPLRASFSPSYLKP
ncbi:uncharacterized protein ARMOST_00592 [Armillaria ostoyae]|uniref:CCHC-type domain-containing protein n=1 Tax=Armillaria ostoyae TaxID=47428 RepID=A0A284QLN4_ARMOS|nr:uncharacterized protein ARMOST_00592 [Armillaria ostoyae]